MGLCSLTLANMSGRKSAKAEGVPVPGCLEELVDAGDEFDTLLSLPYTLI